jgi:hypothetical protein
MKLLPSTEFFEVGGTPTTLAAGYEVILEYLKKHGNRFETEIAEAAGATITSTRLKLSELADMGKIISCHLTRFEKGKKVEGMSCRLAGVIPVAAPGRKPKP